MDSVGQRLEALIKALNINKSTFAKSIDRSTGNVSDWLNNKCNPGKRSLEIMKEKFNISKDWLLYGTGEMFYTNKNTNQSTSHENSNTAKFENHGSLTSLQQQVIATILKLDPERLSAVKGFALSQLLEQEKATGSDELSAALNKSNNNLKSSTSGIGSSLEPKVG